MNTKVKKLIRLSVYGVIVTMGVIIASIPFMKKKEFTTNYSPDVREAIADIPPVYTGDDDDDGGL